MILVKKISARKDLKRPSRWFCFFPSVGLFTVANHLLWNAVFVSTCAGQAPAPLEKLNYTAGQNCRHKLWPRWKRGWRMMFCTLIFQMPSSGGDRPPSLWWAKRNVSEIHWEGALGISTYPGWRLNSIQFHPKLQICVLLTWGVLKHRKNGIWETLIIDSFLQIYSNLW